MKDVIMFIEETPAPYRDETLKILLDEGVNLHIITEYRTKEMDNHNEWEYKSPIEQYRKYSGDTIRNRFFTYRKGFFKEALRLKPTVICSGSLFECFLSKVCFNARVVHRTDAISLEGVNASSIKKTIFKLRLKPIDALWVPGEASRTVYKNLVRRDTPIFLGAYTYDANRIHKLYNTNLKKRSELLTKYTLDKNKFTFLFVGKLIPSRHIEILCKAIELLDEYKERVQFLVCGDGVMQRDLELYIESGLNIKNISRVKLSDLEELYAVADAYIHPGEEPYSLALYEAAICGLPIVASIKVGAVYDCVKNGENGILSEHLNPVSYSNAIKRILDSYDEFKFNANRNSEEIVKNKGVNWSSFELKEACGLE